MSIYDSKTENAFYGWLAAEHKVDADAQFSLFYRGFSRVLQGAIRKRYRSVPQHVADEAVAEAMLTMLKHFGEPRRAALAKMPLVLARLQPLQVGEMHARLLRRWKGRMAQYRLDVLGFMQLESIAGTARSDRLNDLMQEHRSLLNSGWTFVNEVRIHAGGKGADLESVKKVITTFIADLRSRLTRIDAADVDREWALLGATDFVLSMDELLMALLKARVLSMSYVFVVCMNELKSFFRESSGAIRRMRHGESEQVSNSGGFSGGLDDDDVEPKEDDGESDWGDELDVERKQTESAGQAGQPDTGEDGQYRNSAFPTGGNSSDIVDPKPGPETIATREEFFEILLSALQEPVRLAQQRFAEATTKRDRERAEDQIDRARKEHELDCALLIGWADAEGQETMGERLGLTRNQVRYRLEGLAQKIIKFCEARRVEIGSELRAMAAGQSRLPSTNRQSSSSEQRLSSRPIQNDSPDSRDMT